MSQQGSSHSQQLFNSDSGDLSSPLLYGSTDGTLSLIRSPRSGSLRSNVSSYKARVDIKADSRFVKQINLTEGNSEITNLDVSHVGTEKDDHSSVAGSQTNPQLVIWGTDVSIAQCKQQFKKFLSYDGFDLTSLDFDELQSVSGLNNAQIARKVFNFKLFTFLDSVARFNGH